MERNPARGKLLRLRDIQMLKGNLSQNGRMGLIPIRGREVDQRDQSQQDMETGRERVELVTFEYFPLY